MDIPAGYAQAVFSHKWDGDPERQLCTLGLDLQDSTGTLGDIANEVKDAWADNVMPSLNLALGIWQVILYVGQGVGNPPLIVTSTTAPQSGQDDPEPLPQNCAYLVSKYSSAGGRRNRGRMYLPGCSETRVNGLGEIDGTFYVILATGLMDFYNRLEAGVAEGPIHPVILHADGGTPTGIQALLLDSRIATQRRRLRP